MPEGSSERNTANKTDLLEHVSYEFDHFIGDFVPVIDFLRPGSDELAMEIRHCLEEGANAVMMRKHGAISVGKGLEEAYLRILALERACVTFLHS